ncbi:MAG: hypothetical protein ACM31C_17210 [Acidobacteriota bacterium]
MRRLVVVAVIIALAATGEAGSDLVVLGPAADPKVPASAIEHVKKALERAEVGPIGGKSIDTMCAADSMCLATAAAELGANGVVGVSLSGTAGKLVIALMLVDVPAKELVGKREVVLADRRLASDLPRLLRKFLDEAPLERAKELYAQGAQHFNLGEFAQALELDKRAYRIKPLPAFLFNIAQCHRKLGQHADAVLMYQSYLAGVPDAENKALVQSLIAEEQTAAAEEQKRADERAAAERRLEAERIAAETRRADDERKAKEAEAIAAAERRKAEVARIEAEREREKLYNRHPSRRWTYVGAGLGVASAVVGGVYAFGARTAQSAFDNAGCGNRSQILPAATIAQCQDEQARGDRDARLADVLFASGAAVVTISALVWWIDPGNLERPDNARMRVVVGPGSLGMVVRW